jgi:hypothetical protein
MSSGENGGDPAEQRAADLAAATEARAAELAAGVERRAGELAAETRLRADDLTASTQQRAVDLAAETAARALALAKALGETLTEIARRLDEYSALGKRSDRIVRRLRGLGIGLLVSLVLDVTLTVVLGLTAFSAHDTASANAQLVQELHAAQLTSCANGNVFREDQDTIWRDFIGLIAKPSPGESPAQAAKTGQLAAQFLDYVSKVNHPVNCTALYGK